MKLQIKGADLDTAAKWAARLAPTNPPVPVTAGARLVATDGRLQVSATNLETSGTLTVTATVHTAGEVIVSAKLLHTIVSTIPKTADVSLSLNDTGKLAVQILPRGTRWSLPVLDTALWPAFPDPGDPIGEIQAGTLTRAVNRVLPAASTDGTLPVLTGVLCETGSALAFTCTDRYRIAVADAVEWKPAADVEARQLLVPAELVKTVTASLGDSDAAVEVCSDGDTIGFASGPYRLIGRLLAGEYPKCRSLFEAPEADAVTRCAVSTADLLSTVTQVTAGAGQFDAARLTVTPDGIGVSLVASGDDSEAGNDDDVKPVDWWGEPITVGVNYRWLLAALECVDSPAVMLVFTGNPQRPFMVRPATETGTVIDDGYGHLIVAMKLTGTS